MAGNIESDMCTFLRKGKLNKVQKIIASVGFSYSKTWENGYTLIYWALFHRNANVAKWLLSKTCSVNPENPKSSQTTALHLAIELGKVDVIRMLLEKGASVAISNDRLETPLHIICKKRTRDILTSKDLTAIIKLLLRHGALVNVKGGLSNGTPLLVAMRNSYHCEMIVNLLLENGANINDCDMYQNTALHIAIENDNKRVVKLLLENKADINMRNCTGYTPLHMAVEGQFTEITEMLLFCGAEVNDVIHGDDEYQWTALHLAVKNKDERIIERLITFKANVNAKDDNHTTPLHIAVGSNCPELARILLRSGANVNEPDNQNQTPLHFAIINEDESMVQLLLKYNANIYAMSVNGENCVHFAAGNRTANIAEWLISRGVKFNRKTSKGFTVLHYAAMNGSTELLKLFLRYGMEPDVKTEEQLTPLYLAVVNRHYELAEHLLYRGADVNVSIRGYQLLLMHAIYDVNNEMVDLLLNWNANINAGKEKLTPLFVATISLGNLEPPRSVKMRSIWESLVVSIAKQVSMGKRVSQQNIKLIQKNNHLELFYEQCLAELASMKSHKVHNNISYHDILTKNTDTIVSYVRNQYIAEAYECNDCTHTFPIYFRMMQKNYEKGKSKRSLVDQGVDALNFLVENNSELKHPVELPYLVNRIVLSHLNVQDLWVLSSIRN